MTPWLERAFAFEPAIEMRKKLEKNRETFAQYVVRVSRLRGLELVDGKSEIRLSEELVG